MTIVFFSNFINHHQKPVADELYKLTNGNYTFVETMPIYEWLKTGGYSDFSHLPYVLRAWESKDNRLKAEKLALSADVALFAGDEVLEYAVLRSRETNKISFAVGERWLKRGLINLLSPRLLKFQWYYHTLFFKKPFYRLCSSAFAAGDEYKLRSFVNKCYKWGYFTKVEPLNPDMLDEFAMTDQDNVSLMWCSRFLKLKHPELPIMMAERLKRKGYRFTLDMYGSGEYLKASVALAKKLNVDDTIRFCGNVPNEEILSAMRTHSIFLFTSDQNEGWGAVANEAMSNGCVLIGSDAIGSMPYLVDDMTNGMLFKSPNSQSGFKKTNIVVDRDALDSLTEKVEWILNNPAHRRYMSDRACHTMMDLWSPKQAAKKLIALIENLQQGKDTPFKNGPCSKALPM